MPFVLRENEDALAQKRARHAEIRAEIAAARMRLSLAQLGLLLKQNYNPNEPRLPAGQPGGGRWTRGEFGDGYARLAQNGQPRRHTEKLLTEAEVNRMKFASDREQVAARGATRKPFVLASKGSQFQVSPNPSANSNAPLNEIAWLSGVSKFEMEIEAASRKEKVDPDLIRTVVYMETTHGWYDAFVLGKNDTILPMNVSVQTWGKALGLSRSDLERPAVNIAAGAKILKGIIGNLPEKAPVSVIATLYNVLGAPQVNGYGARAQKNIPDKALEKMKSRRNLASWAKHLPHAVGALKVGPFTGVLSTKGFRKFIWRLPALNAAAFAIFAAGISTNDAVWVNRNAAFHGEALGVGQYYWLPVLAHFLLIGLSCFAWLFAMELAIHNLMRWAGTCLSLSAVWRISAILFLDAAALMALSIYLRDAPLLAAIPVYFLPVLVLEILVLAVLSALRRRKMLQGAS